MSEQQLVRICMDTNSNNGIQVTHADNSFVEVEVVIWCSAQLVDELWAVDYY